MTKRKRNLTYPNLNNGRKYTYTFDGALVEKITPYRKNRKAIWYFNHNHKLLHCTYIRFAIEYKLANNCNKQLNHSIVF